MVYTYHRRVQYHETDQMGVVHHSNYIRYFEEARTDFLRAVGLPYSKMEQDGVMAPVLEVTCKYLRPARYEDLISIETRMVSLDPLRYTVTYTVRSEKGETLVTGRSKHCFVNEAFRPSPLSRMQPETYKALLALVEPEEV